MKRNFIYSFMMLMGLSVPGFADSVILMMGDGMGPNHLKCANADKPLYMYTLPVQGTIRTNSYQDKLTDSAAAATAYACGIKTKNGHLGKDPDGNDCTTIAEDAINNGINVGIYSTDIETGASPSAFYSHVEKRTDSPHILEYKTNASTKMDIMVPVKHISTDVRKKLEKLGESGKTFFAFFEGAKIDKKSHKNEMQGMKEELYDFDRAVNAAVGYVYRHPDTTLIVSADHETGGITDDCEFTTKGHTKTDVRLFAYGKHADLFQGEQDNTEINAKMRKILNLSVDQEQDKSNTNLNAVNIQ